MNKFILAVSLLASASSFANDNQLFGEYPAKYFCIKKNRKVVKCFMPTVEEMNAEILKYESGVDERKQKLDDFLDQVTPHKNEIIRIANEWSNEIGENTFSNFYVDYASKLDQMITKLLPEEVDAKEEIGENGKYINFLRDVKKEISEGMTEAEFGEFVFSYESREKIKNFHSLMTTLDTRYNFGRSGFGWDFRGLIPLSESCTKLKGYGQFEFKKVNINAFVISGYKGFDILKDQELLKELLSSNEGKPVDVTCHKVKDHKDIGISYDKDESTLRIPYIVRRGFGGVAGSLNFEFKKSIIISENGFFNEELKEVLKTSKK